MVSDKTQINSFYVIASGLFKYDVSQIDRKDLWQKYFHWQNRINGGDFKATFDYFNTSYYDGYLNNIFPEIRHDKSSRSNLDLNYLNHLTNKQFTEKTIKADLFINPEKSIECSIDFVDLYLFPNDIGIFTIKFSLTNEDSNLGDASDFVNRIRQLNSKIKIDNEETDIFSFVNENILKPLNIKEDWKTFNPQLKTYNILDLKEEITEKEMDYLLYDMGNVSPIGASSGNGTFAPSQAYFEQQLKSSKLSVFKNWSVAILFDTFTRISSNFPDTFQSWEYDYFHIYIHSLHLKFYMYLTNSKISDVTTVTKETEAIRDNFIEFINDYYQTHISYKFLPDMIQDKLLDALEIRSEVEVMETKIKRINEHAQEKRERKMNMVLLILTYLSVISLVHSFSNWIGNLGIDKQIVFPYISLSFAVTIFGVILILLNFRKK